MSGAARNAWSVWTAPWTCRFCTGRDGTAQRMEGSSKACTLCKISKGACFKAKVLPSPKPSARPGQKKDGSAAARIRELETMVKKLQKAQSDDGHGDAETSSAGGGSDADDAQKAVADAKKKYDKLRRTDPDVAALIPDFERKVEEAKQSWITAQQRMSATKLLGDQIKAAEAKLKRNQKTWEQASCAKTKATESLQEAQQRHVTACKTEADAQQALADTRHELANLRRQSAEQVDSQAGAEEVEKPVGLSILQSKALAAILNAIPQVTYDRICAQTGIDKDAFITCTNTAIAPGSTAGTTANAAEIKPVVGGDDPWDVELTPEDFSMEDEDIEQRINELVAAGFEQKQNEGKAERKTRVLAWAKAKREEHQRNARAFKLQRSALGLIKRPSGSKSLTTKH